MAITLLARLYSVIEKRKRTKRSYIRMQSNAGKKAIIIGGGIGGVTAAIALQQAGFDVTVFERADELREVGSGLPLWTNALRALQKIGLNDVLEILGAPVTMASGSTGLGDVLADLGASDLLEHGGRLKM